MHGVLEPQREETFLDRLSRVATEPLDYPSVAAWGQEKRHLSPEPIALSLEP